MIIGQSIFRQAVVTIGAVIKGFSIIARPLSELDKKDKAFVFGQKEIDSFVGGLDFLRTFNAKIKIVFFVKNLMRIYLFVFIIREDTCVSCDGRFCKGRI